jgi:hypothetical protein
MTLLQQLEIASLSNSVQDVLLKIFSNKLVIELHNRRKIDFSHWPYLWQNLGFLHEVVGNK